MKHYDYTSQSDLAEVKLLFEKARQEKKILLLKNFMPDTPTWQQVLDKAQERADSPVVFEPWQPDKEKMFGEIIVRNSFHMQALNFLPTTDNGQTYESKYMPTAAKNINILNQIMGQPCTYSFGLINAISGEMPTEVHPDPHDVVSWHCLGSIEWRIYTSTTDSNPEVIILNPGDVMYLPTGVHHSVHPKVPRASIIFNYKV
jgi:mannose-6-phosphate isomerase-like protein (cupin superfamily)